MKNKTIKFVGEFVNDAGNISFVDLGYILENGGELPSEDSGAFDAVAVLEVLPGTYELKVSIPDSYIGSLKDIKIIEITSGKLVIGDICYPFSNDYDNWDRFLDNTKMLESMGDRALCVFTGGDGIFKVKVSLRKI